MAARKGRERIPTLWDSPFSLLFSPGPKAIGWYLPCRANLSLVNPLWQCITNTGVLYYSLASLSPIKLTVKINHTQQKINHYKGPLCAAIVHRERARMERNSCAELKPPSEPQWPRKGLQEGGPRGLSSGAGVWGLQREGGSLGHTLLELSLHSYPYPPATCCRMQGQWQVVRVEFVGWCADVYMLD
jgi:hypothetical protein